MTQGKPESKFIGVKEAARLLGVSYSTVWEAIRRGDFPVAHIQIGTRWRISRPGLEALMGQQGESVGTKPE